jgi:formylglycine-generating enzyme required for sulfatase activity/serine/threonine protein kinase
MTTIPLALAPGSVVDKLRIDRILGRGAFGITYLVTDEVLGKSFALKEYLPGEQVQRVDNGNLRPLNEQSAAVFTAGLAHFLEEGRTVAPLDHPNIVTVFRCFEANGTAYLLMPYYRGEALHRLLGRSGTLTAEETLALTLPLLNALEYIHLAGVIHQDIKPANIYITETGDPILLDFGAAGQRLGASPDTRWKLGSEGYAAAEQSGAGGDIGPWTDIYGLAATLYRSVTGQVPVAASQRQRAVAGKDPDPLPPVDSLVPAQDYGSLLTAIGRGLAVEPGSRPQSVQEWRQLFESLKSGRQSPAADIPAGIEREGREWLPIILLAVFLVAISGAAIYLLRDGVKDSQTPGDEQTVETPVDGDPGETPDYISPQETERWQAALEADTAFAYQLFMQDFPQSTHNAQAQAQLNILDNRAWQKTVEDGSKSAIEAHLENFPDGLHQADAKILLKEFELAEAEAQRLHIEHQRQDNQAWSAARSERTIAAMDGYMKNWPGGLHIDEAHSLRRRLSDEINDVRGFEAARKLNTIDAFQSYIDAFPNGARVAAALEAIDRLTLRPGKSFSDCADCPTMVVVPAGSYWQGAEDSSPYALTKEKPRRMVTFSEPFAVGVFEVTMAQWDQCATEGGCSVRPRDNGWGRGTRPVIMVSWNDAQEYVTWISKKTGQSYRLPSESEWEYIARAGEESEWPGGDPARLCEFGNIAGSETGLRWQHEDCSDIAALETLPVGSLKPNAFGVHDAIGNVAEWTLDCMNLSYLDAPADGGAFSRGICGSRMTRGGSWFTGTKEVRLPARFNLKAGDRNDFTGFRLVRAVEDQ